MVRLPAAMLRRFSRLTLYNSPYVAHDRGCAVDCYPDAGDEAPSPVAGTVVETHTVRAPPKPYAPEHDHLVVVDVDETATGVVPEGGDGADLLARILHVEPSVEAGDEVAVGEPLGTSVRAGFFAPWVANHLHVGFRPGGANPVRASGSLPLSLDVPVRAVPWDGTGRVVEAADSYAVLDAPAHPAPGECVAGVAAELAPADGSAPTPVVLDGGLPHYDCGGLFGAGVGGATTDAGSGSPTDGPAAVSLLGTRVGVATGRDVAWEAVEVRANGRPITGLSLFLGLDDLYAKLVCPAVDFAMGEEVAVELLGPD